MRTTTTARRARLLRRGRGDRGTALIESAFIFPIIVILVFGIVEIGYLYRSASLVSGAARAGARIASAQYGATYGTSAANQQAIMAGAASAVSAELLSDGVTDTPVTLWIYHSDANGNTQQGNLSSCTSDCFRYTWTSGTKSWTLDGTSPGWTSPDACGSTLDYVGVYVKLTHNALISPASLSVNSITKKTVMRLEGRQGCTSPEGPA